MWRPARLNHEARASSVRENHVRVSIRRSPDGFAHPLWVALSHPATTSVSPISAAVRYGPDPFASLAVARRRVTTPSGVTSSTPPASATYAARDEAASPPCTTPGSG